MIKINADKTRQMLVLVVTGSLRIKHARNVNVIAPTAKPINRPGQTCPSNANEQYLTNLINR